MRTTTWPAPGFRSSTSSSFITSGPPNSLMRIAFMVSPVLDASMPAAAPRILKLSPRRGLLIRWCLWCARRHHAQRLEIRAHAVEPCAPQIFPRAESEKRDERRDGPQLCVPRHLRLRFPAEKLPRNLKRNPESQRQRSEVLEYFPGRRRSRRRRFEPRRQILRRNKQRHSLHPLGKNRQRNGCSGQKKKRHPDQVIDHLRFLHGVRHAGDD